MEANVENWQQVGRNKFVIVYRVVGRSAPLSSALCDKIALVIDFLSEMRGNSSRACIPCLRASFPKWIDDFCTFVQLIAVVSCSNFYDPH